MTEIKLNDGTKATTDELRVHRTVLMIKFYAVVNGRLTHIRKSSNRHLPGWEDFAWENNHPYGWSLSYPI